MTQKAWQIPKKASVHSFVPRVPNLVSTCRMDGKLLRRTDGKFLLYLIAPFAHGFSWLYSLFLGLDANFRLKRKDVSSDRRDNSLSSGWSYFVPNEQYKAHLANYTDEIEAVCFIQLLPLLAGPKTVFGVILEKQLFTS